MRKQRQQNCHVEPQVLFGCLLIVAAAFFHLFKSVFKILK